MKRIVLVLLVLLPAFLSAQVYQVLPQYGYQMPRVDAQLVLKLPSDTTNNKTGIARIGTTLYAGNGSYWTAASGGGGVVVSDSAWSLTGNSGTTAGTNFIGTTDSVDFVVKTKALERLRVNANGALGVGTGTDYGTSGWLLKSNGSSTAPSWVDSSSLPNIYNSDGTLDAYRTLDGGGFTLLFDNIGNFYVNSTSETIIHNSIGGVISGIEAANGYGAINATVTGEHKSSVQAFSDSISIKPYLGQLYIDSLTNAPGTKALRYDPATRLVSLADTTSGGGLSSSNFVFNETPSGTINGVNATFTLANTPTAGTVRIFLRGLRMTLTTDYTISGSTITMINIPDTGDDLIADYLK